MICAQSGVVDGFGDVNVYGVQCLSQWRWCGWLVGGQQRTQQPVVQFGVEDRKPQPVAGEPVAVFARDSCDESVEAEAGQVVAGLVGGVVQTAEQSGHQGAQALVGDAGDGEHAGA
jgi:hypothetical protein